MLDLIIKMAVLNYLHTDTRVKDSKLHIFIREEGLKGADHIIC